MTRFCFKCGKEIDQERVQRRSTFCSDECRREANLEKRNELAKKRCRLCGRPARRPKVQKPELEAVRPSHNDTHEVTESSGETTEGN